MNNINIQDKTPHTKAYMVAMIAVVIWAGAFVAVKYTLSYYSPEAIMLFRFLVASSVLGIIAIIKGVSRPKSFRDVVLMVLGGLSGIFLYMWLFNTGVNLTNSGISSFVIASTPMYIAILSLVLLKERLKFLGWVGIFLSLVGVFFITYSTHDSFVLDKGILILLLAAFSSSFYSIIQRELLKRYTPFESTFYMVLSGTLFMLVFLPDLIKEFPSAPLRADLWIVWLGVFPAALSYLLWGYALSKVEKTAHLSIFLYLVPFFSSFIAYFALGETLPLLTFVGGVVIVLGMLISNKFGK